MIDPWINRIDQQRKKFLNPESVSDRKMFDAYTNLRSEANVPAIVFTTILGTIGLDDGIHLTCMKIGVHAHWTIQQDYRNASLTKKLLKSSITNFAPQYNNWFYYQL